MAHESVFSPEMAERLPADLYEYVKNGTLSKTKVSGVARELISKRGDDGELIYYNVLFEGNKESIKHDTMIGRIRLMVQDWKKYLAPQMQTMIIEAAYAHALKAKDNVASFKAVEAALMPKEKATDDKPALSQGVAEILQAIPVGTTLVIGPGAATQSAGDQGHERLDSGDPLADRQEQDITLKVVSPEHDRPVHGVHEKRDTPERYIVPDPPLALEDAANNNGGSDLDAPE